MTDTPNPTAKRSLNNAELWSGAFWLAVSGFVVWSGLKLGIGSINDPGSGFVLLFTGLLMAIFSLSIIIAALKDGGATFGSLWINTRWSKPLAVILCLTAFAIALEPLGFLLSAIPLMLVLLRVIDPVRWTLAVPIGVLAPVVVWWVLKKGLLIQLPTGILEIG